MGIEPTSSAWKAEVLPLNHTRVRWSGRLDSNQRPSAPKADALPSCATPRNRGLSIEEAGREGKRGSREPNSRCDLGSRPGHRRRPFGIRLPATCGFLAAYTQGVGSREPKTSGRGPQGAWARTFWVRERGKTCLARRLGARSSSQIPQLTAAAARTAPDLPRSSSRATPRPPGASRSCGRRDPQTPRA